jgi:hypothetical protein
MSGLTMGSIGVRPANMTTPMELCNLLGGSRVINKVRIIMFCLFI